MAVAKPQNQEEHPLIMSESEYLEFEEQSEIKHEFVNGQVFAMTGGSVRHSFLIANTIGLLHAQLRGQNCGVMSPETRIKVSSKVSYRYPDVTVLCDKPQYVDDRIDTISNPTALFEILSPSSIFTDRNEKFDEYTHINTVQEYVLIYQHIAKVERFLRRASSEWLYTRVDGLQSSIELPSIGCTLGLSDLYERIDFDEN